MFLSNVHVVWVFSWLCTSHYFGFQVYQMTPLPRMFYGLRSRDMAGHSILGTTTSRRRSLTMCDEELCCHPWTGSWIHPGAIQGWLWVLSHPPGKTGLWHSDSGQEWLWNGWDSFTVRWCRTYVLRYRSSLRSVKHWAPPCGFSQTLSVAWCLLKCLLMTPRSLFWPQLGTSYLETSKSLVARFFSKPFSTILIRQSQATMHYWTNSILWGFLVPLHSIVKWGYLPQILWVCTPPLGVCSYQIWKVCNSTLSKKSELPLMSMMAAIELGQNQYMLDSFWGI